jgi:hypothetical protein
VGEFAGSERQPEEVRKRQGRVIVLTNGRCAAAVGSGRLPVGGGGEAVAALPPPTRFLARGGRMRANKCLWQLPWVLGEVSSCLLGGEGRRTGVLAAVATMAGGGAACAWEAARAAFL